MNTIIRMKSGSLIQWMNIQHIGWAKECAKLSPGERKKVKQPRPNSTCSVCVDVNQEFKMNIAAFY